MTRARAAASLVRTTAVACLVVAGWGEAGALAGASPPGQVVRTARGGDTPETLAAEFYGDRALGLFIRENNGLARAGRLRAGQSVKIPTAFAVKLKRGDTLERLARRYLGDGRRASFLGEWNGLKPGDTLHEGAQLIVPFHLVHKAAAPESLSSLAKTYYGDASQGKLLAAYNFRTSPVLAQGEKLVVPVPHVRVHAVNRAAHVAHGSAGPAAATVAAPAATTAAGDPVRDAELAERVAERLRAAEKAFRDGSYDEVPATLSRLVGEPGLSDSQLVAIHRLLGFAYVALGAEAAAIKEFREVLQRDPNATLDAASISPKIRAVFDRARGR